MLKETNNTASQRKKTTPQSRPNVASKKSSKQIQPSAVPATQSSKASGSTAAPSTPTTNISKPKSPPPQSAQAKPQQQTQTIEHVPLKGFNFSEIDALLNGGIDPEAELYKSEYPQMQKSGPWGHKGKSTRNQPCADKLTIFS